MTCDECLSILPTVGVAEMGRQSRVYQHGLSCTDCARLITHIADSEHDLAFALASVSSSAASSALAERCNAYQQAACL